MAAAFALFATSASAGTLGSQCAPRPMVFPADQLGQVGVGESEGDIGHITASGGLSEFGLGISPAFVRGVTTGPDGATWFTYIGASPLRANVGKVAPDGTVTTYALPPLPNGVTTEDPGVLVSADDGYMYARIVNYPYVARISTDGTVTYLQVPGPAFDVIRGPDGAAWFSSWQRTTGGFMNGVIGRLDGSGVTTQFTYLAQNSIPGTSNGYPEKLAVGPDGRFWFTITDSTKPDTSIGALTPDGQFSFYKVDSERMILEAIAPGPNGHIWLIGNQPALIREVDMTGEVVAQHAIEPPFEGVAGDVGLATGPDGRVWFNDSRYLHAISSSGEQTIVYPPAEAPTLCAPNGPNVVPGGSLSVFGRALDRTTSVTLGGSPVTFQALSPAQIDLAIPASAPLGETSLIVSDGTTSSSLPGGVDIEGEPTITSLSPACGSTLGGTTVRINGTDLDTTTAVTVGGQPATIVEDAFGGPGETWVTIETPRHLFPATVDVRVTTIAGTSQVTPADRFTYALSCAVPAGRL